jgi:hypothetical protein
VKLRQEDQKFKASLDYIARPLFKKKNKEKETIGISLSTQAQRKAM